MHSGGCKVTSSSAQAVIGRWRRYWRLSSSTKNKRFCALSNWRSTAVFPPSRRSNQSGGLIDRRDHVLNLLHRLIDGKAPPASPIDAPQALRLQREPRANVERYDALRTQEMRPC